MNTILLAIAFAITFIMFAVFFLSQALPQADLLCGLGFLSFVVAAVVLLRLKIKL